MAAIYSNGGNRWNIVGFNFTKRDALSSVYKISMRGLGKRERVDRKADEGQRGGRQRRWDKGGGTKGVGQGEDNPFEK